MCNHTFNYINLQRKEIAIGRYQTQEKNDKTYSHNHMDGYALEVAPRIFQHCIKEHSLHTNLIRNIEVCNNLSTSNNMVQHAWICLFVHTTFGNPKPLSPLGINNKSIDMYSICLQSIEDVQGSTLRFIVVRFRYASCYETQILLHNFTCLLTTIAKTLTFMLP